MIKINRNLFCLFIITSLYNCSIQVSNTSNINFDYFNNNSSLIEKISKLLTLKQYKNNSQFLYKYLPSSLFNKNSIHNFNLKNLYKRRLNPLNKSTNITNSPSLHFSTLPQFLTNKTHEINMTKNVKTNHNMLNEHSIYPSYEPTLEPVYSVINSTPALKPRHNTVQPSIIYTNLPTAEPSFEPTLNFNNNPSYQGIPTSYLSPKPTTLPQHNTSLTPSHYPNIVSTNFVHTKHPSYVPSKNLNKTFYYTTPNPIENFYENICLSDSCLNGTIIQTSFGKNDNGYNFIEYTFINDRINHGCSIEYFSFKYLDCMKICTDLKSLNISGKAYMVSSKIYQCTSLMSPELEILVKINNTIPIKVIISAPFAVADFGEYNINLGFKDLCVSCHVSTGFKCNENSTKNIRPKIKSTTNCSINSNSVIITNDSSDTNSDGYDDNNYKSKKNIWYGYHVMILIIGIILGILLLYIFWHFTIKCWLYYRKYKENCNYLKYNEIIELTQKI